MKRVGFASKAPRKPIGGRTGLKGGNPLKSNPLKSTPLAKESRRTRNERPQRQAVIALVHERDNGQCQAAELVPSVPCYGRLDTHEIYTRARFPGSHLHPALACLLCRSHHTWVGLHSIEAQELGLLKWSWESLPDQPYDQDAEQ